MTAGRKLLLQPGVAHSLYIDHHLSLYEIALLVKVSAETVRRVCLSVGVELRGSGEANIGRTRSAETREKISRALKGRVISQETRKRIGISNSGKSPSPEARQKMSQAGTRRFSKTKQWNWKGGVAGDRDEWRYREGRRWKAMCRKRDGYECQLCPSTFEKSSKLLHVHHMVPFADCVELRSNTANGICLCSECHRFVHSKDGRSLLQAMEHRTRRLLLEAAAQ